MVSEPDCAQDRPNNLLRLPGCHSSTAAAPSQLHPLECRRQVEVLVATPALRHTLPLFVSYRQSILEAEER